MRPKLSEDLINMILDGVLKKKYITNDKKLISNKIVINIYGQSVKIGFFNGDMLLYEFSGITLDEDNQGCITIDGIEALLGIDIK